MDLIRTTIGKSIYNVEDISDHTTDSLKTIDRDRVAIKIDNSIYPVIPKGNTDIGLYPYNWGFVVEPPKTEEEKQIYSINNAINFSDTKNITEYLQKVEALKNVEEQILSYNNPDNVLIPTLLANDTPEMRAFKEAIIAKEFDNNNYICRYPSKQQFNNDKKIFDSNSITFGKLRDFANIYDMKITIIIEDSCSNVPNPMGVQIVKVISGGGECE